MSDLTDFLLARIAEDEAGFGHFGPVPIVTDEHGAPTNQRRVWPRVLAECEAKRRIVALHGGSAPFYVDPCDAQDASGHTIPCDTLRALALPYADHPDYRNEWKP